MEEIFKLVGRFFPNRFRETKEQKALIERTLLPSQVSYPGLAVAMCSGCFMPTGIRNEIQTPKQQNRNEKALKLAQHILEKEVKILSPAILQPIKNETQQLIENRQAEKVVTAPESRTSFETKTTKQQTSGRDKFSDITPKIFAPPESIVWHNLSVPASHIVI